MGLLDWFKRKKEPEKVPPVKEKIAETLEKPPTRIEGQLKEEKPKAKRTKRKKTA